MSIRINNVSLSLDEEEANLKSKAAKKLRIKELKNDEKISYIFK